MKRLPFAAGIIASSLLAGCAVGPNYHRPIVPAPTEYKTEGPWRVAAPKDAIPKGAWWEIYNDPELNDYEQQLLQANQSLVAFRQRFGEVADLLLELIGALHVAWPVVAANADKDAALRCGELDTDGFEPFLGGSLRFLGD